MSQIVSIEPPRRPGTLVRAARFALQDYRRDRHTKRLLKLDKLLPPNALLSRLHAAEEEEETLRATGSAAYSVSRHILLLAGLMTEMRLCQARQTAPSP